MNTEVNSTDVNSAFISLDVTNADVIPDGTYTATIVKGELKNSNDGTSQYINWTLFVPEHSMNIFYITSFKAPRMVKAMLDACSVPYTESGFTYTDCIGKQISIKVSTTDDPIYGLQNKITKVAKI